MRMSAIALAAAPGIVDVVVAKNFACANTVEDEPRCWGEGFVGQLGGENAAAGEVFVPRPIAGLRGVARCPPRKAARSRAACQVNGPLMTSSYQCPLPPSSTRHCRG